MIETRQNGNALAPIGTIVTFLTLLEIFLARDPDFIRQAQAPRI